MQETREDFVKECLEGMDSMAAICRKYGISRNCGYKWKERYLRGELLLEQSRRPLHSPNRVTDAIEQLIVATRKLHPVWGPKKLRQVLINQGYSNLPCLSTMEKILKRNGCITPEASAAATPFVRFEHPCPNDLWQMDFKGDFLLLDGTRCFPLTTTDDCSRMNLCLGAESGTTMLPVQKRCTLMFEEYGLPRSILCDNGNPWGTSQSVGYTRLEVWWMKHDILPMHGRPLHPQTQGKEERFHRTFKQELLSQGIPLNMADAERRFAAYRHEYNTIRPHEALGLDTPASHYSPSPRKLKVIEPWEYGELYEARRIKSTGYLTYKGQGYYLSEAFDGEVVGIRPSHKEGCVAVCFRGFVIAYIDMNEKCIVSRRIRREK